jgi:hypothetical protein
MWYRKIFSQNNGVSKKNLQISLSSDAVNILQALASNGKYGLVVGGSVRDALMGIPPKDIDIEVYGFLPSGEFLAKGKEWDNLSEQLKYTNPSSPEYKELKNNFEKVKLEYNALSPLQDLAEFLQNMSDSPTSDLIKKGNEWDSLLKQLKDVNLKLPEREMIIARFRQVQEEYNNLSPIKQDNIIRKTLNLGKLAESEGGTVGKSFGVVKFNDTKGNEYDFSLPRTESKTGAGHTGFRPIFGNYSPEEAAARRDFTIPCGKEAHGFSRWEEFPLTLIL